MLQDQKSAFFFLSVRIALILSKHVCLYGGTLSKEFGCRNQAKTERNEVPEISKQSQKEQREKGT